MKADVSKSKETKPKITMSSTASLRANARKKIAEGAVTAGYSANREQVLKMLNDSLATEIVCMLRYKRHYFMATGVHAESVATEFLEHAAQEQEHADAIAKRIVQLGGEPDYRTGFQHLLFEMVPRLIVGELYLGSNSQESYR